MKITHIDPHPFHTLPYISVASPGRYFDKDLLFYRGEVDRWESDLEALVITSDLQGVSRGWSPGGRVPGELLGIGLARELEGRSKVGDLPPLEKVGILLAGDLYISPTLEKRGGPGNVRPVWEAMEEIGPAWVAGVAGNHDVFGGDVKRKGFFQREKLHFLDGEVVELNRFRVGGYSGVIGSSQKVWRRKEKVFLRAVKNLVRENPHFIVLHFGPGIAGEKKAGSAAVAGALRGYESITICGHIHWKEPLRVLPGGGQVLNVDSQVVVLGPRK